MRIFENTHYDFIRWRWYATAFSLLVIVAGAIFIAARGLPLSIDFTGGTIVILRFENPVVEDDVRSAIQSLPGEKVVQRYGEGGNEILIRLPQIAEEEGTALEAGGKQAIDLVEKANLGKFEVRSVESVGPVIGADLQRKGIYATIASLLGIMAYIALRFRLSFALGAIVATLHDVAFVLIFLAFAGYELSLNVVAAILAITGYSVNDTIVIFDRVRENLKTMRRESLYDVVNLSVNHTLSRTVITSGTTLLAVVSLYLFGGEVLKGFAFAMMVGVIAGTYSTMYVASAIAIALSGRRTPTARAAAPAAAAQTDDGRARKPGRNVRVS
ncbi:MAG TPA: protein translocase subunit SecF [Vicinamibacterales bacterium]|nr:protein translocase subunit SecF [Vicinamibacterales bacterium]